MRRINDSKQAIGEQILEGDIARKTILSKWNKVEFISISFL